MHQDTARSRSETGLLNSEPIPVLRTMYQRKVDVDTLNAVKSVLADVSSRVSPSSEQRRTFNPKPVLFYKRGYDFNVFSPLVLFSLLFSLFPSVHSSTYDLFITIPVEHTLTSRLVWIASTATSGGDVKPDIICE